MLEKITKHIRINFLPYLMIIFGIAGFIAAFTLSIQKIELIKNETFVPSCSVSYVFNCGTVMKTEYAEMFGFPNSFMGVAGYPLAILAGIFLIQNRKLNKFLTWFTTLLTTLAFGISYYWLYLSAYVIGVFCPYCLISTTSASIIFFSLLTINLYENNFGLNQDLYKKIKSKIEGQWNVGFVILWFIIVIIFAYWPFFYSRFLG